MIRSLLLVSFYFVIAPGFAQGLKDYYKSYFPVGVAVTPKSLFGDEGELIKKQFNSLTAENVMKMGPIHPEEFRYNWGPADTIVDFAQANKMKMRGHTLVWHRQTPWWFFRDSTGHQVSKDLLLQRLKDHITTVVSRYKGKIYAWDVVNEVIDDQDTTFYRQSLFYKICGEEFIAKAFEYAHAADPNALLFYNDYSTENPKKREKILKLVTSLKRKGVPIHGVGLQGHWSIYDPKAEDVEKSIGMFAATGLQVQITEMDMSVYRSSGASTLAPGQVGMTPKMEELQVKQYGELFKVFRKNKKYITGVTFWNVSDRHSWLDNFPVPKRKNYPLLFDEQLVPKKAYFEVTRF